tara:strand:+ start:2217 stop:2825 length:609 start_codon:yes stop_codon:yes gene_type:complete
MYSENELIDNYYDRNIDTDIFNIDQITSPNLLASEQNSLDYFRSENDILKGEIQRLQYENKKIKSFHEVPENFYNGKDISKQKRKSNCLSDISSTIVSKKSNKKQDVSKQYEKFKRMISKMTNEKLPFANVEIYKNPNTCSVSLIFENHNLIRLIRERNKFSNDKKPIVEKKSESDSFYSNETQIRNILNSTSMMYRDVFAN